MTKPLSWSHSALKDFEGCARRYHATKVLKLYPYEETEATRYGNQLHKAAENYIRDKMPLPKQFDFMQPLIDTLMQKPGKVYAEQKMALSVDLEPRGWFDKDVWVRGIADMLIVDKASSTAWVIDWKGLALDTPLPTPTGWTTMADVAVGDALFSESGDVCYVTGKSKVKTLPCYRITFDDTSTVVCDEEHLWKLADGSVQVVTKLHGKKPHKHAPAPACISVAAPLALSDAELPIDPYVLGLWLADGKHTSGEISKPDSFVWEEIQRRGYTVNMATGGNPACPTRTVKGLRGQLEAQGLRKNKHIPLWALRAGYQQRLDLLRGLMDGDGSANPTRKQAVFTSTSKVLSDGVLELLCSLGQRPLQSMTTQFGFGKTVTAYPISFRPLGINPFLLPRKADRIDAAWGPGKSAVRQVVSVEAVPSVPTQCIAVDSSDRTFLCTRKMIPTHNTGNDKYPDTDQLLLMALMVMVLHPEIDKVHSALFFVAKNSMVKHRTVEEEFNRKWKSFRERVARIEAAAASGNWNPAPSPLCGWCPHKPCEHNPKHTGE